MADLKVIPHPKLKRDYTGSSAGVYWTADQLATWHPDDFDILGERLAATGVSAMAIHGELCFGC
jgi:hypothetical protein